LNGQDSRTGLLDFLGGERRPLRTSWLIVGIELLGEPSGNARL